MGLYGYGQLLVSEGVRCAREGGADCANGERNGGRGGGGGTGQVRLWIDCRSWMHLELGAYMR